jgi:hypothetical protein
LTEMKAKIRRLKRLMEQKARQTEFNFVRPIEKTVLPVEPKAEHKKPESDRPPGLEGLNVGDLLLLEADEGMNQEQLKWFQRKSVHWKRTRILPFM